MWLHATPKFNCESIESYGLRPSPDQPVHLSMYDESALVAFCWLEDDDGDVSDVALYEVDVQGLPSGDVRPGWDVPEQMLAVHCTIPPSNLRRVR